MKLKDERAKMCNEILNGIKVIKLYAWEPPMETVVERIRQKELSLIKRAGLVRAIADSFNTASPFLVALLTFTTYTLISDKNALTPQLAFVSLTLFNQLRSPMTMISYLIQQTVQAIVANKRLKDFLVADEIDSSAILRTPSDKLNTVELEKASFTWGKGDTSNLFSLQNVNLNVPQGSLFAIVGPVGCGKSSLLSAILGEMEKLSGHAAVRGRISYVPQQPWIQNMTLRENIIFGKEFDPVFYDRVIDSCALRQDISMLPQGDSTEIGEKGINLSGGQKARVSLARAVYQNNDLYLLDDPLSAVDSHVGSHIFNEVIGPNGLLRNKTRILVTHGLSFTKDVDKIVIINDGKIAEIGTYNALLESRDLFSKLMEEMKSQGEENNDEPETAEELDTEENDKSTDVLNTQFDRDEGSSAVSIHLGRSRRISTVSDLAREAFGTAKRSKNERLSSLSEESTVKLNTKVPLNGKGSKAAQLIETERTETGRVKFSVYVQYIRAATIMRSALFCLFFASFSGFQLGRSLWLANWSDANDNREDVLTLGLRLGVYAAFGVCEVCGFALSIYFLVIAGLHASRNLHFPLLHSLLRSPMSFFDTTPLGRILNRFGKDIDIIDQLLPINFRFFVMCILQVFSTVLAIMLSTPVFAAVVLPLGFIYYASLRFYVPTSRQIKRLQSITRSPIYSHFGETIQGAASVRAYQMTDSFRRISEKKVDTFIQCAYLTIISNRWLAIRLEFVGNCTVLFAALFAALARDWGMAITAGAAGLSVSYALNVTETLNFAVRQVSELETNIVAVERVKEYAEVSTEAEWKIDDHAPPKNWPSEGGIALQNYSVRYRDGLDLVLKNIDLQVLPCEKIAIVGRTGAGKSSLTLALFRMIEASGGKILIDGINIAQIGLHDLRSRLSIIPQDPVLFSGSLRFNLDPFHSYSDHEIWEAIELAHLSAFVSSLADGLNHVISEGGENISVGQRQLVCLARALLRKSRVLILDEATAAVDMATDALIQETIRKQFRSSTVISIAHRLITILDYDRIVVLDKGRISEVDTPQNLLANRYSVFHSMAVEAKIIS
ncbi:hypothetical protein AB6A40_005134 [Gnathostoma spinigerum]|uniref:Multidrug resistance-associated protein 1 n=1 Tax=Gnathostoma spinigerum TaxID=75299 RepID=A0ABD6EEJ3_9BILA